MSGLTAVTIVPAAATARADSPISRVIDAVVFGLITMMCTGPPVVRSVSSGSGANSSSPGGSVAGAPRPVGLAVPGHPRRAGR